MELLRTAPCLSLSVKSQRGSVLLLLLSGGTDCLWMSQGQNLITNNTPKAMRLGRGLRHGSPLALWPLHLSGAVGF